MVPAARRAIMTPTLSQGLSPVRSVLDNGAVVLVHETPIIRAVAIRGAFRAGTVHDPADAAGLAHLMGRVIDRGTERRTVDVIAEELDERGVSLRIVTTRHLMTLSCTCLSEDF